MIICLLSFLMPLPIEAINSSYPLPSAFIANVTSSALQIKYIYSTNTTPSQMAFRYEKDGVLLLAKVPISSHDTTQSNNLSAKTFMHWIDGLHSNYYYTICTRALSGDDVPLTDEACVSMTTRRPAEGDPSIDIRGVALVLGMGVIIMLLLMCGIGYEKFVHGCPALWRVLQMACRPRQCCQCTNNSVANNKVHPSLSQGDISSTVP